MAKLAPANSKRQMAYCYSEAEFQEVLGEVGLTPTPVPGRPLTVRLPDGRTLTARDNWIGGAMDEEGSDRIIVNVSP